MRQQPKQPWHLQVREQIRGYLFENLALKGLAVLVVSAVWLSVAGQTRPRANVILHNIDVSLDGVPPGFVVTDYEPRQVSVRVRGPEDAIRELRLASAMRATDMVATADVGNTEQGTYNKPLSIQNLPHRVELQDTFPASFVRVTIEPIHTREVTIKARLIGQPPPGYRRVGVQVTPDKVMVSGPESRVLQIEEINTTTVNLNGRTGTFTESVDVDILETQMINTVGSNKVVLRVEIEEETGEQTIENVPVSVLEQPDATTVPATLSVTIRGPVPVLKRLSAANVSATLPADALATRSYAPEVTITGPDAARVEVVRAAPATVRVRR